MAIVFFLFWGSQLVFMISKPTELLSDRVQNLVESATLRMAQLARDLKAKGKNIISLSIGEPDFDTPEHIKEAAYQALRDGYTHYTPVPGLMELREAIAKKFERDNAIIWKAENIVVSNGAKQSIANVIYSLINRGDEVIIFSPYWVSYIEIIRLCGGVPVQVQADIAHDFKVNAAQLSVAITEKTKLVLFSSPCNPTGSVYSREELVSLAKVIEPNPRIMVMSDEIYEYINFTGAHASMGSIDGMEERTITVNGFSKGFAMTGWRLGYIGAPKWIADACTKIQGQFTSGAAAFSQKAAVEAISGDLSTTHDMREAFLHRRDVMIELLRAIPGFKVNVPEGAFYIFPDISAYFGKKYKGQVIEDADAMCEFLIQEAGVGLVSGSAFGDPNCVRFSYAASEEDLREAVRRIAEALAGLT